MILMWGGNKNNIDAGVTLINFINGCYNNNIAFSNKISVYYLQKKKILLHTYA